MGCEVRKKGLDLGPGLAVADDIERPAAVRQPGKSRGKHPVGRELVAVPHHRDGEEPHDSRTSRRRRGRVGPLLKIDEGRQLEKPLSVAAVPFESLAVGLGHHEDRIGAVERRFGAGMRRRPGAARALAGARGLRHDIGNAQERRRPADRSNPAPCSTDDR